MLEDALAAAGAATVVLALRDKRPVIRSLSASIESLTGYAADVLTKGDAFMRMLDEHDAGELERKIVTALREERAMVAEFVYDDSGGRARWMQLRAEPERGTKGLTLAGVLRETTETRQLMSESAGVWARFHALADATPAMLWVMDPKGGVTAVNRATERFYGATEAALLGDGWLLSVEAGEAEGLKQFIARVVDSGISLNRDVIMNDPDDRARTISLTATVAKDAEGQVASVVLTGRDITDRSEADKQRVRLEGIFQALDSPAMILAPDFRVAGMNQAARARAGLGDSEAADTMALWHVVTQETVEQIRRDGVRYCEGGGTYHLTGKLRSGESVVTARMSLVGLGEGWLGLTTREIEDDLVREAQAKLDKRRLEVMLAALEHLTTTEAASDRAPERVVEAVAGAYPDLRAAYATAEDDGTITVRASDEPAWMGSAVGRRFRLDPDGSIVRALREGEIVQIGDVWAESQVLEGLLGFEEHLSRRLALVRVETRERQPGLLLFEKPDAGRWNRDELEALELAARLLGLAQKADRERRGRIAAEARAAEHTQRWRQEQERAEELARLASDRVAENERLAHRLQKADGAWAESLVELSRGAASVALALSEEARGANMGAMADRLAKLGHEAELGEIAGRIASGTLTALPAAADPKSILRTVGQRLVGEAKARGVVLRISQGTKLPDAVMLDAGLLRIVSTELLAFSIDRCSARELRAIGGYHPGESGSFLELSITGGPVSTPGAAHQGAPKGLAVIKAVAKTMGGDLEINTAGDETTLLLRVPAPLAERAKTEGEDEPNTLAA
jgi:PAS domain S-box-containing protein